MRSANPAKTTDGNGQRWKIRSAACFGSSGISYPKIAYATISSKTCFGRHEVEMTASIWADTAKSAGPARNRISKTPDTEAVI